MRLPKSILNRISQCIFTFLWGGTPLKRKKHLFHWKILSIPFSHWGRNIKNLDWFSLSLRLKILWSVLRSNGLWFMVIQVKYLKRKSIECWLHKKKFYVLNTSHIWNGFINVLPWINNKLGWKVGNGSQIKLGTHQIARLNSNFVLYLEHHAYLQYYGITHLL